MTVHRNEIRRRYTGLVMSVVLMAVLLMLVGSMLNDAGQDDGLTPAAELGPGDCFLYPGDGVEPQRVRVVPCAQVHYGEVFGIAQSGDDDACVDLFETYTGAESYWETGYILGFIDIENQQMLCFLYGPEDLAGSLRA